MKKIFDKYFQLLDFNEGFINKYLNVPCLKRLKNIGYFCGMDYASKNIYDFSEYISRYDHSLIVASLTWKFTKDKKATLAALFHDISTPCFSHVIDYMNKDYSVQESTEEYTEYILKNDIYLTKCLEEDNLTINDIACFKKYSIVDNMRPKMCVDRLDGVILTGLFWTKSLNINDVKTILDDIKVYINEYNEKEIGFKTKGICELIIKINEEIDVFCHSKEDIYMMELLANITNKAIQKKIIKYEDLFKLTEDELFNIFYSSNDEELLNDLNIFKNIKLEEIIDINLPGVKVRELNPLVNNKRLK